MGKLKDRIAETWRSVISLRVLTIVFCAMVFAVLAGPFGTLTLMTTSERILLWVPLIALSVVLGWLANVIAQVVLEGRHLALIEALAVVMMTTVFAPCVWFLTVTINPDPMIATGGSLKLVMYVFIVVAAVAVVRYNILVRQDEINGPPAEPDPRLLQRLPKTMQGPVLRISAKDHRIEIVTKRGTTEVRLRLSDAVAEMEPVEGFMTHRSHWVAKSAVVEACRANPGKIYLKLVNGDLVPVSRTFRPDWINAGLLDASLQTSPTPEASVQAVVQAPSEQPPSPRA